MQNSIGVCFFCFRPEISFLGKFGPTFRNQNVPPKRPVSLYKVFILRVTIYRVEFKGENNDQVNISKTAFKSIKYRWSTRQSSTFFQGFFKVSTLYHMWKSISPTGCFRYNEMLREGLGIFLKMIFF